MALNAYVDNTKTEIYINNFIIDDSTLYISFALNNSIKLDSKLNLSFNLVLENDEVKRNAVSFNGIFKLRMVDGSDNSELYLKPRGIKKDTSSYATDLLTYPHRGSVSGVFEKIKELPELIDFFIKQVSEDAKKIRVC